VWSSVSAGEEWELCTCVKEGVDHARTRAPARHGRSITYLTPAVDDGCHGTRPSRAVTVLEVLEVLEVRLLSASLARVCTGGVWSGQRASTGFHSSRTAL
jgi:hypothetical protein